MSDALYNIRNQIKLLHGTGKKATRTQKNAAIAAIAENLSKRATCHALTKNSIVEVCTGPPNEEAYNDRFLSWSGLAVEVIDAMADMLDYALSAKTKKLTVKMDYVTCLKTLIKNANASNAPGVLRGIVSPLFTFLYQWLSEPGLRALLSDVLWQIFRDMLLVEDNRAMLTSGLVKNWARVCVEQIVGRGDFYHQSDTTSNFAKEAFVLLAKPTSTWDVLSRKQGRQGADMVGFDYGWAVLAEKCCQILIISKSLRERHAREAQATALNCITVVLENHCLDFTGSAAAKKVLELTIPVVFVLWTERRYVDCVVRACRMLVRLALCNNQPESILPIRERIETDLSSSSSSMIRTIEEVRDAEIEVAGLIFGVDEVLQTIRSKKISPVHLSVWLRVLGNVLERDSESFEHPSDIPVACARVTRAITELFSKDGSHSHRKLPVEVLVDCCLVVQIAVKKAAHVLNQVNEDAMQENTDFLDCRNTWSDIYTCFLEQLMRIKYANSYRTHRARHSRNSVASAAEQPLMECLVLLLSSGLVDKSVVYAASSSSSSLRKESLSWQSLFSDSSQSLSSNSVRFLRAHISVAGVRNNESSNFSLNLCGSLLRFCDPQEIREASVPALQNAISSILGLSRGVCVLPLMDQNRISDTNIDQIGCGDVDAFISHFCTAKIGSNVSGESYVQRAKMGLLATNRDLKRFLFQLKTVDYHQHYSDGEAAYFNISPSVTASIEHELVEQVLCFLDSLSTEKEGEEESSIFIDEPMTPSSFMTKFKARYSWLSDSNITVPLKESLDFVIGVAFIVADYLGQGVRHGVIGIDDLEGEKSVSQLLVILFLILEKLAATAELKDVQSHSLLSVLIEGSASVYSLWRSGQSGSSTLGSSSGASQFDNLNGSPLTRFSDLLSKIVSNVCGSVCCAIEKETSAIVSRIKTYIYFGSETRGSKRTRSHQDRDDGSKKKRRKGSTHGASAASRKKALAWSDDSDDSDDDKFPDSDRDNGDNAGDGDSDRMSTGSDVIDVDSIASPQISTREGNSAGDSVSTISRLASVLKSSIRALPKLREIVLEQCKNCLEQISKLESQIREEDSSCRALVASGAIDSGIYFNIRTHLWEIFFHDESRTIDACAVHDVIHFAKKWEELEERAAEATETHLKSFSSKLRDRYPPLQCHERLRCSFLDYASRALRTNHIWTAQSENSQQFGDRSRVPQPSLLSGIVEVYEMFRERDGSNMPRTTRIAFSLFSIKLLYCIVMSHPESSQELMAVDGAMMKPSQNIREWLRNMMMDCDAGVRMAVAGAYHVFLKIAAYRNNSGVVTVLEKALPSVEQCSDCYEGMDDDNDADFEDSLQVKSWKLSNSEVEQFKRTREPFERAGASGRGSSALVTLGEVGAECPSQLPTCLFEILSRISQDSSLEEIAFNVIVRLCVLLSVSSPEQLFAIAERLVLPNWFTSFKSFDSLKTFPVRLVLDSDRCRPGALIDWMKDYTSQLLPFILLSDKESGRLTNTKSYCDALGYSMNDLLESYVGPLSRVYPMMFIGNFDRHGINLWRAIDTSIDTSAADLIANNREEVFIHLLTSISAGSFQVFMNNVEGPNAFFRDCSGINPPFYDPVVIWTALNQLCKAESETTKVFSSREMKGQLLNSMESEPGEAEETLAVSEKLSGKTATPGTLVSILLAVWKLFSGPPCPVHPQNRTDAFLIVGAIWKITGYKVLQELNRRRLFLKLVIEGFRFRETAFNALWLFKAVVEQTIYHGDNTPFTLRDFFMDEEILSCSDDFDSHLERRMFELLSLSFPILVDLSASKAGPESKAAALDGLKHIAKSMSDQKMWKALSSVDLVPNEPHLAEVRKTQERAWKNSINEAALLPITREMSTFVTSEQRISRGERYDILTVSKLRRLRKALVEENRALIASSIQEESWLRSEGRPEKMLDLLNDVLGYLIDITQEISPCSTPSPPHSSEENSPNTTQDILQECTWLIGVLGTIHPTSLVFESRQRRKEQRIVAVSESDDYEVVEDGILKALPALRKLLFGGSPMLSQVAYTGLVAVLGSSEGREVYANNKLVLEPLKELRVIARKKGSQQIQSEAFEFYDAISGCLVDPKFLNLTDKKCWALSKKTKGNESPGCEWIKRVTATLAFHSINSAFKRLASTCFVSEDFSRLMFPYLLMDLASYADDETLQNISRLITKHVLRNMNAPFEAVRYVVHGLDTVCQLRLDDLRLNGVGTVYQRDGLNDELPHLYSLDIPYQVTAEAAARVGMYFSAARYASLHIEHECVEEERTTLRSRGSRSSAARASSRRPSHVAEESVKENARRTVEHVFRVVADNINEPDMGRGLGQDDDLLKISSQVAVLDANWSRSIGTLDAMSNQRLSRGLFSQNPVITNSDSVPKRELMVLSSLHGLGCTNMISCYWDTLKSKVLEDELAQGRTLKDPNQYLELVNELNERRFAAAWKLSDWEIPDVIVPSTRRQHCKQIIGLHQTIHRTLAALSSGDTKSMSNALQCGRESQVDWLGQMDTSESAYRLYQMAGRVRMLNKIESVVSVCTGTEDESGVPKPPSARNQFLNSLHSLSESQNEYVLSLLESKVGIGSHEGCDVPLDSTNSSSHDLSLDLLNSIARCVGSPTVLAKVSANVSEKLLASGGIGSWARAATALGSRSSVSLSKASAVDAIAWQLQESRLRWTAGQDGRAKQNILLQVKTLLRKELRGSFRQQTSRTGDVSFLLQWANMDGNQDDIAEVRAQACQLAATWCTELRDIEPIFVFMTFLELGLKAFDRAENLERRNKVHYFMAEFADAQITTIDNYRKTKKYESMVSSLREAEKEIANLENIKQQGNPAGSSSGRRKSKVGGKTKLQKDFDTYLKHKKRNIQMDKVQLSNLETKYAHWRMLACRHYAGALRDGSANDLRCAFRLVALWLDSGNVRNLITKDLIPGNKDYVPIDVPLSKLLPLFSQLCSRLGGSGDDGFQDTLSATLEAMAKQFPTHCLWQLLALSNSTRVGTEEKLASFYKGDKEKKDSADRILERLKATGDTTIVQMKKVTDAYMELSETPKHEKDGKKTLNIGRKSLCSITDLSAVAVPTMGLPLYGYSDPNYKPPHIVRFEKQAGVCGGLSRPLTVKCVGSDGQVYSQLVKGRDDLRGDAVMEQMFTIFNELLRRDSTAARRRLIVRTYRIVPLSPFSGIMQFVMNTEPLGAVLIEGTNIKGQKARKSLHERYRPHDMTHSKMSSGAFNLIRGANATQLRVNFLEMNWHKLQPVFRYFFLERWPDPVDWYSRQLAYTRSVAVMSIVGFILGIGDRHLSNVLMDTALGEVVHIDFGIAFEQGKLLPTPELMPFRLSRDVVDGFGVRGVDGAFRRCCEVTLDVLRKNKDVLLTVIEVLLHDPMYNWGLSPEEVLREQMQQTSTQQDQEVLPPANLVSSDDSNGSKPRKSSKEKVSEEAQRALRRIAEKLDGMEETNRLSVEAHVARLIDEARAFQTLASVYPGWSPWI